MSNRILLGLLISGIQVALYYLVMTVGWNIGSMIHEPTHHGVASGLTLVFSVYVFGAVVAIQNTIDAIVGKKSYRLWLVVIATLVFASVWVEQWRFVPLRIILIITSGFVVLVGKFLLQKSLKRKLHSAQGIEVESPQRSEDL